MDGRPGIFFNESSGLSQIVLANTGNDGPDGPRPANSQREQVQLTSA